jgi:putative transposase
MQAVDLFEQQVAAAEVAARLRVSAKSAYQWQATWRRYGRDGLLSKGAGGAVCRLDAARLARLEAELDRGPAAHGWDDQRWTLARVAVLIGRLFHQRYTLRGVSYLLHRMGWSPQVPVHRAVERDDAAITAWRTQTWPRVKAWPTPPGRGSASRTRPVSR